MSSKEKTTENPEDCQIMDWPAYDPDLEAMKILRELHECGLSQTQLRHLVLPRQNGKRLTYSKESIRVIAHRFGWQRRVVTLPFGPNFSMPTEEELRRLKALYESDKYTITHRDTMAVQRVNGTNKDLDVETFVKLAQVKNWNKEKGGNDE